MKIETRGGSIWAKVWRLEVGRCHLFLLDSDVKENNSEDRELSSRLHGGDERIRLRQNLLLGLGGMRALRNMGITPGAIHLNESHGALVILEAIVGRMQDEGVGFYQAMQQVCHEVIVTVHATGTDHQEFGGELIEEHLGPLREQMGLSHKFHSCGLAIGCQLSYGQIGILLN